MAADTFIPPELIHCYVHRHFMPAAMNEQNEDIKPNIELSNQDKAFMTINYPPDDNTNKMEWTIEQALDVVGVGDREKNQIIESYRNSGWASLRNEFAEWSKLAIRHGGSITDTSQARVDEDNVAAPITKEETPVLSADAQAIEDGFRRMGVYSDPRIQYGRIPSTLLHP